MEALEDASRKKEVWWQEIRRKIQVSLKLDMQKVDELWELLSDLQDFFTWNKGELECYLIGEYSIDTQGFPPCHITSNRFSRWEEGEVKGTD